MLYSLEMVALTKTGGRDGGGRVEDVMICVTMARMDKIRNVE